MRAADVVGRAQRIACCGEIGVIGHRCEIAQRRVRLFRWLRNSCRPARDLGPGLGSRPRNRPSLRSSSRSSSLKLLAEAILHRLSWRTKCQTTVLSCAQANMAFEVNSVPLSDTIMPGLPRRLINAPPVPRHAPA